MTDASSLHCPNCGAAADPEARRCPYCKARLATISCPSCFALMFDGSAFCHACGARRSRVVSEGAGAPCPGCGSELQRLELGATPLLECVACDGVWIEAAAFEQLCTHREAQAAVLHRFPSTAGRTETRVRYRKCVRCGKMMNRVNFGKISGAVVDVCSGHGTFLDAGELHHIVSFIHAGGLERARERQLQDLKEQERRLRALEAQAARSRGATDPHAALNLDAGGLTAGAIFDLLRKLGIRR